MRVVFQEEQDELLIRNDRAMQRRITMAGFRDVKRLEDFDFGFNPSIKKNVVFELAACRFVREKREARSEKRDARCEMRDARCEMRDALLLGPPGTGKSHLVQGVDLAAIRAGFAVYYRSIFDVARDFLHDEAMDGHERVLQKYLKPELLIIDDMGMKQLPKRSGVPRCCN